MRDPQDPAPGKGQETEAGKPVESLQAGRYKLHQPLASQKTHPGIGIYLKNRDSKKLDPAKYVVKPIPEYERFRYQCEADLINLLRDEFGQEAVHLFQKELELTVSNREEVLKLWSYASGCERAFAEAFSGQVFRLILGAQQAKTRLFASQKSLFLASKYVFHKETLYQFQASEGTPLLNQRYLKHYAEGLICSLLCISRDLHALQVLINDSMEAIFIDFDATFEDKIRERKKTFWEFNAEDIQFLPFVGKNGEKGGSFEPHNWLNSYIYKSQKPHLGRHDKDPGTYKNPKFQRDKHRGILMVMLAPDEIFALSAEKIRDQLSEAFPNSGLPDLIKKIIFSRFERNKNRLITEAMKIPEFRQYLENISLFELLEIALDFDTVISDDHYLSKNSPLGTADLFYRFVQWIQIFFEKNSDKFKMLPLQIRFAKWLWAENRKEFFSLIFSQSRFQTQFFREEYQSPLALMSEFSYLDYLFIKGELDENIEIFDIKMRGRLPKDFLESVYFRVDFISRVVRACVLMKEPLACFDMDGFLSVIQVINKPCFNGLKPTKPGKPSLEFLILDATFLRDLLTSIYSIHEDYIHQCIALNVLAFLLATRKKMINALKHQGFLELSTYVNQDKALIFVSKIQLALRRKKILPELYSTENVLKNSLELASRNASKTRFQEKVLQLFRNFGLSSEFFSTYFGSNGFRLLFMFVDQRQTLSQIISLLIHVAFDPEKSKFFDVDNKAFLFFLIQHYFLAGRLLEESLRKRFNESFPIEAFLYEYKKGNNPVALWAAHTAPLLREALAQIIETEKPVEKVQFDIEAFYRQHTFFQGSKPPRGLINLVAQKAAGSSEGLRLKA